MRLQSYFDSTDEPSQQIPYMYHYANAPGRSTQTSRQVISQFFSTATNGLPGNDDSGAMGSYVVSYLAGLYPVPATRQYLLSSSYFPSISFFNPIFNTIKRDVAFSVRAAWPKPGNKNRPLRYTIPEHISPVFY